MFNGDYWDKQAKRYTLSLMTYIYNADTKTWCYVTENPIGYNLGLSIHVNDNQIFLVGGVTGTHDCDKDDDVVATCMLLTITSQ